MGRPESSRFCEARGGFGEMAGRSMRRWLCVALAVVCLNSLWTTSVVAVTNPTDGKHAC